MAARNRRRRVPGSCWKPAPWPARESRAGPELRAPCRISNPSLDRWTRQYRLARLQMVGVIERVPGRGNIAGGRMWLVVPHEFFDPRARPAAIRLSLDIGIGGIVDLRDQGLEAGLEDQRMEMRRPVGMAALRLQQAADHAIGWNRIADEHHRAEGKAAIGIGRELAAQVHVGLLGVLVLV